MKSSFAGISQDLAIRVQGFKDYLVGSLQDLAAAAEQLELSPPPTQAWENESPPVTPENERGKNSNPQFVEKSFKEETRIIRRLLDQYRTKPDYYGPPWQLRRTFEPIHAERVSDWFFLKVVGVLYLVWVLDYKISLLPLRLFQFYINYTAIAPVC